MKTKGSKKVAWENASHTFYEDGTFSYSPAHVDGEVDEVHDGKWYYLMYDGQPSIMTKYSDESQYYFDTIRSVDGYTEWLARSIAE